MDSQCKTAQDLQTHLNRLETSPTRKKTKTSAHVGIRRNLNAVEPPPQNKEGGTTLRKEIGFNRQTMLLLCDDYVSTPSVKRCRPSIGPILRGLRLETRIERVQLKVRHCCTLDPKTHVNDNDFVVSKERTTGNVLDKGS